MATYTISKGNHSANGVNFGIHSNGATVTKAVIFKDNCAYNLNNVNQYDINKLYGFSVGLFNGNDYNSARFGWRWSIAKQQIELMAYIYVNGKRLNEWDADTLMHSNNLNTVVNTEIAVVGNQYRFRAYGDGYNVVKYFNRAGNGAGYNQYPYFGGQEVAPHDITIELI